MTPYNAPEPEREERCQFRDEKFAVLLREAQIEEGHQKKVDNDADSGNIRESKGGKHG
jgi:hypothetical protein